MKTQFRAMKLDFPHVEPMSRMIYNQPYAIYKREKVSWYKWGPWELVNYYYTEENMLNQLERLAWKARYPEGEVIKSVM